MSGGWVADRGIPVEVIVVGGLLSSAALMLVAALVPLPDVLLIACIAGAGFLFGFTTPSRDLRAEERRVGKEGVSTWRSRGSQDHEKKMNNKTHITWKKH